MDCGKDFYGDEYAAHTSCISEAEKYQGALFTGEKGGKSKGERKQQEWLQVKGNTNIVLITKLLIILSESETGHGLWAV